VHGRTVHDMTMHDRTVYDSARSRGKGEERMGRESSSKSRVCSAMGRARQESARECREKAAGREVVRYQGV
jgi:hypothetical protein